MTTNELTADMIDRSARDFDPLRIILFGSHTRGDATPDSDIDLLVVLAKRLTNDRARRQGPLRTTQVTHDRIYRSHTR